LSLKKLLLDTRTSNSVYDVSDIKANHIYPGAGAAGASSAYHLRKFAQDAGIHLNITVYERSSYVGGRSTTVNAFGDPLEPVELGASIFVEVNKILRDAANEFGLHLQAHHSGGDEPEILGIWNGEKFVYKQKGEASWFDLAKLFWKYGLAPIRTQRLMRSTVGKFLKLYEPPFFPFRSLSDRALDLELTWVTAVTGEQFLAANNVSSSLEKQHRAPSHIIFTSIDYSANGHLLSPITNMHNLSNVLLQINPPFTTEIIQASTRVNYGQNLGIIHGLETMVCMAIEGAMSTRGGNWQV
jgi:prenylcysteine oxidase / farnesylcysteine lyase